MNVKTIEICNYSVPLDKYIIRVLYEEDERS